MYLTDHTINISIPFRGRQLTGVITCNLDIWHTTTREEAYGSCRRIEEDLDVCGIGNIKVYELEWEGDGKYMSLLSYDRDQAVLTERWNRILNKLPESFWLDSDMIIEENPSLWEDAR